MDVSLDEYIGKQDVNFRVQISNPNAGRGKGSWGRGRGRGRLGNQKTTQVFSKFPNKNTSVESQSIPLSVTVSNKAGFDARDKITNRKRPLDARDALAAKAKSTDARMKILKLKSQKSGEKGGINSNQTGDARAKIKAKQQARQPQINVTGLGNVQGQGVTGSGGITRTINQGPGPVATLGGVDFQVKRPLTNSDKSVQLSGGSVQITRRVGRVQQSNNGLNLTKSIANPQKPFSGLQMNKTAGPVIQIQNEQYQSAPHMYQAPVVPQMAQVQSYVPHYNYQQSHITQSHMIPVQSHMTPVQSHTTPIQSHMVPVQSSYNYPQEQDYGEVYEEYEEEEEELVDDFDSRPWAGEPTFPVTEKTLTVKMPQFTVKNRPSGNLSSNTAALVNKVSTMTAARPTVMTKRKPTALVTAPPPAKPVSGPLRLSGGPLKLGGVNAGGMKMPARQTTAGEVIPLKRAKILKPKPVADEEDMESEDAVLSPLQGFRILVSNLHLVVSQDDIIELFGAIGPMKRARLLKQGTAEVIYVQKTDALKAVQKYNNRELDGQAMQVKLLTSAKPQVKAPPDVSIATASPGPAVPKGGPLRLGQNVPKKTSEQDQVDVNTLHRALFRTGGGGVTKPVTFTVKI